MRAFPCQSAATFPASLPRRSRASLLWRSLLVSRGVPLPLPFLSGASYSVIAPLQAASLPLRRSLPASSPLRCPGPPLCHCVPAGQQLCRSAQASNIFPMALCRIAPGQQLRYGAPASNQPHRAEKSTPVWLAIWRTWAGFANSQLRCATFRSTY